eukprot:CAMPEP_0194039268 /NCGR_PEP_ID=MMETSP0009_2-20130614/11409_1 /TAXON_ID=210454 /ORGANISM="Grammatophora oceanica, Strain CCMP 410" /LENGTH=358 /DNA_ID=CAMNT_0038682037 /DNA_START=79 /DNA_END=1152 /DNA_ORIENTATION=+
MSIRHHFISTRRIFSVLLYAIILLQETRTTGALTTGQQHQQQRASQFYPAFLERLPSLEGRTVVVTGCSRGLGYATASSVVKKGGSLIMLNRKSKRSTEVLAELTEIAATTNRESSSSSHAALAPRLVECDLLDFSSVRKACAQIRADTDELHVLCNNAGIMLQPDEPSVDGYDITASTNVLSHFLITKELFPLLKRASAASSPRIVNMSSLSGYGGPLDPRFFQRRGGNLGGSRASMNRYSQSKLANLVFTVALDDRLRQDNDKDHVLALACTPGLCGTDMFVHATTVMTGQPAPRDRVPSAEDGAMAQLHCIFSSDVQSGDLWGPKLGSESGELELMRPIGPPQILVDDTAKEQLW